LKEEEVGFDTMKFQEGQILHEESSIPILETPDKSSYDQTNHFIETEKANNEQSAAPD
jgi:hypothetical protein